MKLKTLEVCSLYVAAHGVNIDASPISVDEALSGTSFAAPLVTGWIAVYGVQPELIGTAFIDRGEGGRASKFGIGELRVAVQTSVQPSETGLTPRR